jgi:hypothetical protein
MPPLEPAQLHDQGFVPLMDEAVPLLHRLPVGSVVAAPAAEPHAPLIKV